MWSAAGFHADGRLCATERKRHAIRGSLDAFLLLGSSRAHIAYAIQEQIFIADPAGQRRGFTSLGYFASERAAFCYAVSYAKAHIDGGAAPKDAIHKPDFPIVDWIDLCAVNF